MFVVLCAAAAYGDSIPSGDPTIKQGGGDPPGPTPIFTPDFTILSPSGTSPAGSACMVTEGPFMFTSPNCEFQDVINPSGTGLTITKLVFDIAGVPEDEVTCALINMVNFATCSVGAFGDGGSMVTFSGAPGIPFQGDFTLNFDGFPKNTSFGGTSTVSPEPGTLALFLGGIGALLVGRRLRVRNPSQ
jgi:hypothetical protein